MVRAESGAPTLALHGTAAALAAEHGVAGWHISLTHTATMAEAVVIAVGGVTRLPPAVTPGRWRR